MNRAAPQPVSWAARLPRESLAAAAALRLRSVECCAGPEPALSPSKEPALSPSKGSVWLRGTDVLEEIQPALAGITGAELFTLSADGAGTPLGARVPSVRLPPGPWTALAEQIAVKLPVAVLPGTLPERVQLRLVRTERQREPNVLMTSPEAWRDFALAASAIRLRPLKFALSTEQALIHGQPVPSIPGTRYSEEQGLAVPSGFALAPVSDPEILIPLLGLSAGDLALFFTDGSWELIESGLFVSATRSAVRQSFKTIGSDAT